MLCRQGKEGIVSDPDEIKKISRQNKTKKIIHQRKLFDYYISKGK